MKKGIGYIFYGSEKRDRDLKEFKRAAKKKGIELILFNLSKKFDEKEIESKAKRCKCIFNNSGEDFACELAKTLESLGKKVIDSSKVYYYEEDKWLFFLKCKKNKIPTPETILLSESLSLIQGELKNFNHWPVILKRVEGCGGSYVEKAKNISEAIRVVKKLWKKGSEKYPLIAQEFIPSPSYRVTAINNRIVQTAIKESTGWKHTGLSSMRFKKLKVDKKLRGIVSKTIKMTKLKVCGIDLLKKGKQWMVLEINSSPGIGFFDNARQKLAREILSLMIKEGK